MAKLNRDNQKGFTIVELVVVIIILGILAAAALPRFMDVSDDAYRSSKEAVAGSLKAGLSLKKAYWVAKNKPSTDAEGNTLSSTYGYPEGACNTLFNMVMDNAPAISGAISITDEYDWVLTSGTNVQDGCTYTFDTDSASSTIVVSYAASSVVTLNL